MSAAALRRSSTSGDPLLLVAHGSRRDHGQAEMEELAARVAAAAPGRHVRLGYLELCDPPAGEVLAELAAARPRTVTVVPLMLFSAGHAKSDVPAVVLAARARHPGTEVRYARPLGTDDALLEVASRRLAAAGAAGLPLAVLARGTSDPDANAEACRVARLLADRVGSRPVVTGFSSLTWPEVPEALDQLHRLSEAPRLAAFAWFLATGVLVERMRTQLADFAAERGIEVVDAGHLGTDDAIAALILERADEAASGAVRVNCDTCVHRRPWPGLEDRHGAALGAGHSHLAAEHLSGADHVHAHRH